MDVRYSFTPQFLRGAALFARRSREIEESEEQNITEELVSEHRACVVAAIMQSTAALEAEISEVLLHGPGHHLGSDLNDHSAHEFLLPLADIIDDEPTLRRYDLVLHLLNKPSLNHGVNPYQDTNLLIKLRNELVHYKSKWERKWRGRNYSRAFRSYGSKSPSLFHLTPTSFLTSFSALRVRVGRLLPPLILLITFLPCLTLSALSKHINKIWWFHQSRLKYEV